MVLRAVTPPKGSGKHASVIFEWNIGGFKKVKEVKLLNIMLHQEVFHATKAAENPPAIIESNNETLSEDNVKRSQDQISASSVSSGPPSYVTIIINPRSGSLCMV